MAKRALITGITGQDGAYLAQLLLSKGYEVVGAARRSAERNIWRLKELGIDRDVKFCDFELLEFSNILLTIERERPAEVYNLGAQSFVSTSFEQPIFTGDVDALGVARLLEAVRTVDRSIRFYQASTSEMFGKVQEVPQKETTPFYPRSPYGVAKLYAHWMTVNYREGYGMFACNGILFNHESPLRGIEFVTRKITHGLAEVAAGLISHIELGNLEASRDWGFAGDYVEGMWRMLQVDTPQDFVLATGRTHSVRHFCELACKAIGLGLEWRGAGVDEEGIDPKTGQAIIKINPRFYRPAEVDLLIGDRSKAEKELGWVPRMSFEALVASMALSDLQRVEA